MWKRAAEGLDGWVECFPKAKLAGVVFGGGATAPGEVRGSEAMQRALALMLALALTGCGAVPSAPQRAETTPTAEPFVSSVSGESDPQDTGGPSAAPQEEETMLYIQIGDATFTAVLEDGPITLEAENYGGFEKTARLPEALPPKRRSRHGAPGGRDAVSRGYGGAVLWQQHLGLYKAGPHHRDRRP